MAEENDPIKEFYAKHKQAKLMINTTEIEHGKAYMSAVDKHLRNEQGNVDYDLLENEGIRHDFIDAMVDHYVSAAKAALKSELGGKTELEKHILVKAYAGITKSDLADVIHEKKSEYTKRVHDQHAAQLTGKQSNELMKIVGNHLKKEHIPKVVDYTKTTGQVNIDMMKPEDAGYLLSAYDEGKSAVTPTHLEGKLYSKVKSIFEEVKKKKKGKAPTQDQEPPEYAELPKAA